MDERTPQQIIIFTGHDCSGKTEIAKELSRRTKIPYFKNKNEKRYLVEGKESFFDALKYDQPYIIQFLEQTGHSVIFDRCYESEWVYSLAFNRQTDFILLNAFDAKFAQLNTKIIICYKDLNNYYDDFVMLDEAKRIKDLYFKFAAWTKCLNMLLDTSDENLESQINKIMEWI